MTITLKLSKNTQDKMIKYFSDKVRDKTPAYAIFQADEEDTVVTLYQSGKAVFQGVSADIDSAMWKQMERHLNPSNTDEIEQKKDKDKNKEKDKDKNKLEDNKKARYDIDTIGSDEVGTGDFFGPIVVTSCFVSKEDIPFLEEIGIKDSKKLTDEKIVELAKIIVGKLSFETTILTNKDYNKYHSKDFNMNKIKAVLHNKVLILLSKRVPECRQVVVDQFTTPASYYKYLSDSPHVFKNITFLTKAEDISLPVACASIISRYFFIKKMKEMGDEIESIIPFGASDHVNNFAASVAREYGIEKLEEMCKLNFKNYDKVKEML